MMKWSEEHQEVGSGWLVNVKEDILFCLTPNKKLAFFTKEQIKNLKFLLLFLITTCKNILKKYVHNF